MPFHVMPWLWQACHARIGLGYVYLGYVKHAQGTLGMAWLPKVRHANSLPIFVYRTLSANAHSQFQPSTELPVPIRARGMARTDAAGF